jgi:hypothetical protein
MQLATSVHGLPPCRPTLRVVTPHWRKAPAPEFPPNSFRCAVVRRTQVAHKWKQNDVATIRPFPCAGAGFLRVLRFPLPISIPPISPQSPSSVIWGWYNRPVEAAVPSGLSLTPLIITIIIIIIIISNQSVHIFGCFMSVCCTDNISLSNTEHTHRSPHSLAFAIF